MVDSLAYIRDVHPDVFQRTRYRIVEISAALAAGQTKRAEVAGLGGHVEVLKSDFFKWEGGGVEPCYVVALEVMVSHVRNHSGRRMTGLGQFRTRYDPIRPHDNGAASSDRLYRRARRFHSPL